MLDLAIYGLVGLAAMLVVAFYFAYGDGIHTGPGKVLVRSDR